MTYHGPCFPRTIQTNFAVGKYCTQNPFHIDLDCKLNDWFLYKIQQWVESDLLKIFTFNIYSTKFKDKFCQNLYIFR